jgi:hypothetical protein
MQDTTQDGRPPKGIHTSTHLMQQVLVISSAGAALDLKDVGYSPFRYFPDVQKGVPAEDYSTNGG